MNRDTLVCMLACLILSWVPAAAQSDGSRFQAGAHVAGVTSGEFDTTDVGVGGRLSWHPAPLLGMEAELTLYPEDLPDNTPFSRGRVEGLFGATVGPVVGRARPFARLRPGFVTFQEAPGPIACIAIFPPPLSCTLAAGRTMFALDVGGGVEVYPTGGTFIRLDAGDRMVRYPGPVIDGAGEVRDDAFFGHDFRFAIGGGVRF